MQLVWARTASNHVPSNPKSLALSTLMCLFLQQWIGTQEPPPPLLSPSTCFPHCALTVLQAPEVTGFRISLGFRILLQLNMLWKLRALCDLSVVLTFRLFRCSNTWPLVTALLFRGEPAVPHDAPQWASGHAHLPAALAAQHRAAGQ